MADIAQIEQVIMNLAVNAQDAMPEGGCLTIETATVELDDNYTATHQRVKPGLYIMLAISDTGSGMDDDTRENMFEPFFSTKGEQGTGLGLATVYGIVKQHEGNIWVYSEQDKGTTFKIYLPVSDHALVEKKTSIKRTNKDQRGSETIMLVEDDELVSDLAHAILSQNGYKVPYGGKRARGNDTSDLLCRPRALAAHRRGFTWDGSANYETNWSEAHNQIIQYFPKICTIDKTASMVRYLISSCCDHKGTLTM